MGKAFSIAELMIVAAVIGILAALVMPCLHNHAAEAKETAAKDNLRVLRGVIEVYAACHGDVAPGYIDDDASGEPSAACFCSQAVGQGSPMRKMPVNPFNGLDTVRVIKNGEAFPAEATGQVGWIYKPATKTIRIDWPGQDRKGALYFDY